MAHDPYDDRDAGIVWLDAEGDEAPVQDPGPVTPRTLSRRTRLALVLGGVGVLAAVTVGVLTRSHDRTDATRADATRSTEATLPQLSIAPIPSSERTFALDEDSHRPQHAIVAAFPGATITGFGVNFADDGSISQRFYNARLGHRTITVVVGPRRTVRDSVSRTAHSVSIEQDLAGRYVKITVRARPGATSASDFAAIQRLVLDTRLLATR
ncbi:hypothetical protein SAMN05443575_1853 [Jatrophihabitans endophyticus]|uniref:Uncharacterized protein n=1 Tax=Jatrophihabitans endophyticus TaxID=1206085 RepID=A0A1M5ICS0_9ACTN|nr:hypothetical protein [Jatrophihabitans endophyticus]SHG26178.1 hypothetical protein SAMN05443575_1853 [Jatrophihabitans endophyticus]